MKNGRSHFAIARRFFFPYLFGFLLAAALAFTPDDLTGAGFRDPGFAASGFAGLARALAYGLADFTRAFASFTRALADFARTLAYGFASLAAALAYSLANLARYLPRRLTNLAGGFASPFLTSVRCFLPTVRGLLYGNNGCNGFAAPCLTARFRVRHCRTAVHRGIRVHSFLLVPGDDKRYWTALVALLFAIIEDFAKSCKFTRSRVQPTLSS